jgi:GAF domain-containing protein
MNTALEQAAKEMMSEARSLSAHIRSVDAIRAKKLADLNILYTPTEAVFDDIVEVTAKVLNAPVAIITLVDTDRAFIKASLNRVNANVEPGNQPIEISFCRFTVEDAALTVVPDTHSDPRFAANPYVTSGEIGFYAGMPLVTDDGVAIGALCVCDTQPRENLNEEERVALEALARVTARIIQDRVKLPSSPPSEVRD